MKKSNWVISILVYFVLFVFIHELGHWTMLKLLGFDSYFHFFELKVAIHPLNQKWHLSVEIWQRDLVVAAGIYFTFCFDILTYLANRKLKLDIISNMNVIMYFYSILNIISSLINRDQSDLFKIDSIFHFLTIIIFTLIEIIIWYTLIRRIQNGNK